MYDETYERATFSAATVDHRCWTIDYCEYVITPM